MKHLIREVILKESPGGHSFWNGHRRLSRRKKQSSILVQHAGIIVPDGMTKSHDSASRIIIMSSGLQVNRLHLMLRLAAEEHSRSTVQPT